MRLNETAIIGRAVYEGTHLGWSIVEQELTKGSKPTKDDICKIVASCVLDSLSLVLSLEIDKQEPQQEQSKPEVVQQ